MNVRVQLPRGCLGETETELNLGHALSSGTAHLSERAPSEPLIPPLVPPLLLCLHKI